MADELARIEGVAGDHLAGCPFIGEPATLLTDRSPTVCDLRDPEVDRSWH